jgi:flagellar basal-body rod protein FlgB
MDFEGSMERALASSEPAAVVYESMAPAVGADGNNVDLEQELAEMGRNRTMYQLAAQILGAKFRLLASALDQQG